MMAMVVANSNKIKKNIKKTMGWPIIMRFEPRRRS
jgi:hypothetical protein